MLHDELAHFASGIVHGLAPSANITGDYANYSRSKNFYIFKYR